ncbi:MAG: 2,4-didehydro-3-deoxy-L-rhamnonate hydrolase, partial [Alphaproteobacteria bacterium]|nr:2,4-didehydro-3-deoxy-L-rhamnonate hydrolase [Alphaproteobacteria bacterium]
MNGRAFKLGTFAKSDGKPFAAIVLDDTAIHLAQAHEAYRGSGRPALRTSASSPGLSIQDLLGEWDANFAVLQEMVAFLDKEGGKSAAAPVSS